nr:MAG TPA: hypothetical protein [Caudoviricetes sp.]
MNSLRNSRRSGTKTATNTASRIKYFMVNPPY